MKSTLLIIFYIVGIIHHIFTVYVALVVVDFSKAKTQECLNIGRFSLRFATSINVILQIVYMILALIQQVTKTNNNLPDNEKWWKRRGLFFTGYLTPFTLVIAGTFWIVYYTKREAIMPEGILDIVPFWINYNIHSHVLLLIVVELLYQDLHIPNIKEAMLGFFILSEIYTFIFFGSYFETGQWMYPIYVKLTWFQRVASTQFLVVLGDIIAIVLCVVQQFIHKYKINRTNITKKIS